MYKSHIEMLGYIIKKGYDIQSIKSEKKYKVVVWFFDKCIGEGKIEYKCWKEALYETTKNIYQKIN